MRSRQMGVLSCFVLLELRKVLRYADGYVERAISLKTIWLCEHLGDV